MQKNGLVLGGGGSRGSYQIGVWQALIELDIDIHIVTGTSVGALNAALVTLDMFDNALKLWKEIKTSMVLSVDLDDTLTIKQQKTHMIRNFLHDYAKQGGTDSYPLKRLLNKYCDEDLLRKSPIECGIVVFDKKSFKPKELYKEDIPMGQINDYLLASSSLFPAIKSCLIDEAEYIDGGYYDNLPVELALNKGADNIIAVDLDAIGFVRKESFKKVDNLKIIKSYWDLGPLFVFDNKTISRNIRLGYLDTMKTFNAFDGIAYTFIKNEIPAFIKKNKEVIIKQNSAINMSYGASDEQSPKEKLFYVAVENHLKRKYSKEIDMRYSTFLKSCAESAGEIFSLDPEKIYSLEMFNKKLLDEIGKLEIDYIKPLNLLKPEKLKEKLSLLEKTVRTAHIAIMIKNAVVENKLVDIFPLMVLLPDELLAAYYLALIS